MQASVKDGVKSIKKVPGKQEMFAGVKIAAKSNSFRVGKLTGLTNTNRISGLSVKQSQIDQNKNKYAPLTDEVEEIST